MLAHGPVKAFSDILIDQGLADSFLPELRPEDFEEACKVRAVLRSICVCSAQCAVCVCAFYV